MKLALWVEEHGCVQTDFATLNNIRLLDMAGAVAATSPAVTEPVGGTFSLSWPVTLLPPEQNKASRILLPAPGGPVEGVGGVELYPSK